MDEKIFIAAWIQTLNSESIKSFPKDFDVVRDCKIYKLPKRGLLIGKEFFGEFELLDAEGSEVLRVDSYEKAKYILYANKKKPESVSVPQNNFAIKEINNKYEMYLDSIIKRIDQDYRKKFPGSKNFAVLLDQIFKHLNLTRLK